MEKIEMVKRTCALLNIEGKSQLTFKRPTSTCIVSSSQSDHSVMIIPFCPWLSLGQSADLQEANVHLYSVQ
ncbi:hypothetical protein RRG08_013621 [Elysia crispata]|uniref:Uncharacterized protein n=1 Tax=Elysia crispata TaxID=231223 RepID=A0AAE0YDP7_9GAST|nr:hypothetical protein RRG08_013621 [Elysia crispata]